MTRELLPSYLSGKINAIQSKSVLHRMLFASALAEKEFSFPLPILSSDVKETADALNAIGAEITVKNGICNVKPIVKKENAVLRINESGTTLRFILPLISALGINAEIALSERLSQRPLDDLTNALTQNGSIINRREKNVLCVSGRLRNGTYSLAGNVSSQFVSALLISLPLLDGESRIALTSPLESKGYVDLTGEILAKFSVKSTKSNDGYVVPGNSEYIAPQKLNAEGDWSNSAFLLTMGAINGSVTVSGLDVNSVQPDRSILNVFRNSNVKYIENKESITVKKSDIKPFSFDATDNPDLVPVLAGMAAFAEGRSVISGISRLEYKESDRIKSIVETLVSLGAKASVIGNTLEIIGQNEICGGKCKSFNDHRIVMLAALLSLRSKNGVVITSAEAINKSYPSFFDDLERIGGKTNVICNGK